MCVIRDNGSCPAIPISKPLITTRMRVPRNGTATKCCSQTWLVALRKMGTATQKRRQIEGSRGTVTHPVPKIESHRSARSADLCAREPKQVARSMVTQQQSPPSLRPLVSWKSVDEHNADDMLGKMFWKREATKALVHITWAILWIYDTENPTRHSMVNMYI